MAIRHSHTLVLVQNIQASTAFYTRVLNQRVLQNHGTVVLFEGCFALHQAGELMQTVYKEPRQSALGPQGHDNVLIYFETDDLAGAYMQIVNAGVPVIHPIERQAWGQSVFRFHDPDGHIVEIGEPL